MARISISIVILSYSRFSDLKSNLPGLLKDLREGVEIIVVDNASSDGSREFLTQINKEYEGLTVILMDQNMGVAIGRNTGFKIAKGDFVVSLDDDASMSIADIAKVPGLFEQYPNAGILAFKVYHSVTGDLQNENGDNVIPIANFHGAGHAIKKEVFDKCGYLDELCTFGAEELDFSIRAHAAGFETIFVPHVCVFHNSFIRHGKPGIDRLTAWTHNFSRVFFKHFCLKMAFVFAFRNTFNLIKYSFLKYGGKDGFLLMFKLAYVSFRGVLNGLKSRELVPDQTLTFYDNPELKPFYGNKPLKLLSKIYNKVLRVAGRCWDSAGIPDFTPGPSILMYHSIADNAEDLFTVSVNAFREQMTWLSDNGFEIVPLSFLLRSIKCRNYGALRKKVVITFDDGYKDFVPNALPVLLDHNATATVFLVTDMLGGTAAWNKPGPCASLMCEDDVRYIKSRGISLGSHTATHANLKLLGPEALQRQLTDSRDSLTRLGESFHAFAYPWGQWSAQALEAVKASGYECALSVSGRMRLADIDTFLLPRITMRSDISLKRFKARLTRTEAEMEMRRRCRAALNKFRLIDRAEADYVKE